jgi:DNA polymerase
MIVTLGRYSMARYFPGGSISKLHGTSHVSDGVTYFAMYHPAAALHQGSLRKVLMEDMLKIPPLLERPAQPAVVEDIKPERVEPKQLSMF